MAPRGHKGKHPSNPGPETPAPSSSSTHTHTYEWVGACVRETPFTAFYNSVRAEGRFRLHVGDFVHLHSTSERSYIGQVESLSEIKLDGAKKVNIKWFYRQADIHQDLKDKHPYLTEKDVFSSNIRDTNDLESVESKCTVAIISTDEDERMIQEIINANDYVCRFRLVHKKTGPVLIRLKPKASEDAPKSDKDLKRKRTSIMVPQRHVVKSTHTVHNRELTSQVTETSQDSQQLRNVKKQRLSHPSHINDTPLREHVDAAGVTDFDLTQTSVPMQTEILSLADEEGYDDAEEDVVSLQSEDENASKEDRVNSFTNTQNEYTDQLSDNASSTEEMHVPGEVEIHVVKKSFSDDYFNRLWRLKSSKSNKGPRLGPKYQHDFECQNTVSIAEESTSACVWQPVDDEDMLENFLDQARSIVRREVQKLIGHTNREPKSDKCTKSPKELQTFNMGRLSIDGSLILVSADSESFFMRLLHEHNEDVFAALSALTSQVSSLVTLWSPKEQQLFNEGHKIHGENLLPVKTRLPNKNMQQVIDYYYRYIYPAQQMEKDLDRPTRERRETRLTTSRTKDMGFDSGTQQQYLQLHALEFLKKSRETHDDVSFHQLLSALLEYQHNVISIPELVIRVQSLCKTTSSYDLDETFVDFCNFLPRAYKAAVLAQRLAAP